MWLDVQCRAGLTHAEADAAIVEAVVPLSNFDEQRTLGGV
jgi:hypothetical protein